MTVRIPASYRARSARGGATLSVFIALALALTGCAPATYDAETARDLQNRVAAVTTAVANADWVAAESELLELEAAASTAVARGEISEARAEAIRTAIGLVRTEVTPAVEAQRLAAEQRAAEEERVAAEAAAAAQAEADRLAAELAAAEDHGGGGNGGGHNDEGGDKKDEEEKDD